MQPVAGFCHHGPPGTQVVAFRLRGRPAVAYKLAGFSSNQNASPREESTMTLTRRPTLPRAAGLTPLALALSLGFAASAAQAQSLKELYEAARAYDATYLGSRAQADSAQYRADQAHGLRLPTVGLQASSTLQRQEADSSSRQINTPITSPPTYSTQNTSTEADTTNSQVALSAQQTVFNRANDATISQADRGVEIAQAQLRVAEQDLIVRIAQGYFDVLSAADTLGTVQASKKAISDSTRGWMNRSSRIGSPYEEIMPLVTRPYNGASRPMACCLFRLVKPSLYPTNVSPAWILESMKARCAS
jgi:outer membrane protein